MSCVALVKWYSTCSPFPLRPVVPLSINCCPASPNPFKLRLARVSRAKSVAAKSTKGVKIKQATLQDYKLWHTDAIKQMSLRSNKSSGRGGRRRGQQPLAGDACWSTGQVSKRDLHAACRGAKRKARWQLSWEIQLATNACQLVAVCRTLPLSLSFLGPSVCLSFCYDQLDSCLDIWNAPQNAREKQIA